MKFLDKSIELAYQLAPLSNEKFRHFCFIFDKNRLISTGYNDSKKMSAKASYFGKRFNVEHFVKYPFLHSEVDAISRLFSKTYITGKENLVVIRVGRNGHLLPSKPCKNCSTILTSLGFKSVYYSIEDEIIRGDL